MAGALCNVDDDLERAKAHILNLERQLSAFTDQEPYTARVEKDPHESGLVSRIVAVKNPAVGPPNASMVVLAGKALCQLRSALDQLVYQLVIRDGGAPKLEGDRRHQFPIFKTPDGYAAEAPGMIDGISESITSLIQREQPYKRLPDTPEHDALWILQDLDDTYKNSVFPAMVVALGIVRARNDDTSGDCITVEGPIPLKDGEVLFRFIDDGRYKNIRAKLTCSVSFQQAMGISGVAVGMDGMLWNITSRVANVIAAFRPMLA